MQLDIPEKAGFLLSKKRYKVLFGGRGSGKSHSIARVLLAMGVSKKHRILCCREIQKSIKFSVHQLLRDTITALGLDHFYTVLETEIRGANGTQFLFSGLADQTVDSIKSFENVSVCWVEEAQTISRRSLDILSPTIRAEGSEIWLSFNPELESDIVYKRFVATPREDTEAVEMNWRDNPWFSQVLENERKECQRNAPEDYDTIWEGKCRPTVVGAIYSNEVRALQEQGRFRPVPYDPMLQVHTIWDLGWADSMTISFVQRAASEVRVIDYIEGSFRTLEDYVKDIKTRRWNWGYDWIPHDGRARDFKSGMSTEEMLRKLGRNPMIVPQIGVEEGIKATRLVLPRMWLDSEKCGPVLEHLKRYRRTINAQTNMPGAPLHDEHSHCLTGDTLVTTPTGLVRIDRVVPGDLVSTPNGGCVVTAVMWRESSDLVELEFYGSAVVCTADHPIVTSRGIVRADNIRYDDVLYVIKDDSCSKSTKYRSSTGFASTESERGTSKLTSSSSGGKRSTCTGMSGSSTMGLLGRALKSITSMVTRQITALRTLSGCLRLPTAAFTGLRKMRLIRAGTVNPLNEPLRRPECGTQAMKAGLGTLKTESATGSVGRRSTTCVSIVEPHTGRCVGQSIKLVDFALTVASQPSEKSLESMTSKGSALSVTQHSPATSTQRKLHAVSGARMRPLAGLSERVFDLTVEREHVFFANGLLVHNCADNIRYLSVVIDQINNDAYAAPNVQIPHFDSTIGY